MRGLRILCVNIYFTSGYAQSSSRMRNIVPLLLRAKGMRCVLSVISFDEHTISRMKYWNLHASQHLHLATCSRHDHRTRGIEGALSLLLVDTMV